VLTEIVTSKTSIVALRLTSKLAAIVQPCRIKNSATAKNVIIFFLFLIL
jgi:hypothetical protein